MYGGVFMMQWMVAHLWAFNIAPTGRIIRDPQSDPESYFGYTVALQSDTTRVIVGAPRSSNTEFRQSFRPGAIYSCESEDCEQIRLERDSFSIPRELKDGAWVGGALDVSDTGSDIAVCGPRRVRTTTSSHSLENGMCYSKNSHGAKKLTPLDEDNLQTIENNTIFYYAFGEAGLSVHLTPSLDLIIGAPGVLMWAGTVIKYSRKNDLNNPIIPNPGESRFEWDGYAGYAVTSGEFSKGQRFYVTSAPRSNHYRGQVYVFNFPDRNQQPLEIRANLLGTQMGEYFGATLAAADVNGDGIDDLLVGSPLFSSTSSGDMGAVYVYLGLQIWNKQRPLMLFGNNVTGARFGSSIGALADLDLDGFKDVAIGAPYEESGVVYIYRGSPTGLSPRASQRIAASSVESNLRGFGISISRGVQVNGKPYPDLVVGAYDSGHAILFKTLPVIRLDTRINRRFKRIESNEEMRFLFEICVTYSGKMLPANLEVITELTVDNVHHRAYAVDSSKLTFLLEQSVPMCKPQLIALKVNDKLGGIGYYGLMPVSVTSSYPHSQLEGPLLSPDSNVTDQFKIQIIPACEKDECVPLWRLDARFLNEVGPNSSFALGSPEPLRIRVAVQNDGDSAFLRRLLVVLPEILPLKATPVHCERQGHSSNYTCLSALRLAHGEKVELELNLDPTSLKMKKLIEIIFSALSYDSENVTTSVFLNVVRVSRLEVSSWSSPDVPVLLQSGTELPTSISLTHGYEVYCTGISPIPSVRISLSIPIKMMSLRKWHRIFSNFTLKALRGDHEFNCIQNGGSRKRRDLLESADVRSVGCGSDDTVECMTAVCVGGPIAPKLTSIILSLTMNLDLADFGLMVDVKRSLLLNSSVMVEAVGESETGVLFAAAGTLFVVPKLVRDEPFLHLYIAIAVIIAIVLLAIASYALWKCGFFKRREIPRPEEESLRETQLNPPDNTEADVF